MAGVVDNLVFPSAVRLQTPILGLLALARIYRQFLHSLYGASTTGTCQNAEFCPPGFEDGYLEIVFCRSEIVEKNAELKGPTRTDEGLTTVIPLRDCLRRLKFLRLASH
jgi:hypothetical protein